MFSVVNVYLDNLKFCVVCIGGRSYVCCSECNIVSNNCMSPPPARCNLSARTVVKLCTLGVFAVRGELGFLNCDDICMCVMNKQFELLEFVFDSVHVDLPYYEISLTFTAGSVVSVVMWSSLVCL